MNVMLCRKYNDKFKKKAQKKWEEENDSDTESAYQIEREI